MGEKGVAVIGGDDVGEGMHCSEHPYRNNPGGICASCLQEKLGKLVSSSKSSPFFPLHPPPSSSPSSPHSFRSDAPIPGPARSGNGVASRSKIRFLGATSSHHNKKATGGSTLSTSSVTSSSASLLLKRSKSVAPRPLGDGGMADAAAFDSPRKKSFWSFLYLSSSFSAATSSSSAHNNGNASTRRRSISSSSGGLPDRDVKNEQQQLEAAVAYKLEAKTPKRDHGGGAEAESPSFGRKVSRSRSVGCGSRSFSGDFLERLSTGFGDCTLRRVESHREAKHNKIILHLDDEQQRRVKCAGFLGGFGITTADLESSSTRISSATPHVRSSNRGWGWAFASPMRAFRPTTSSSAKAITVPTSKANSISAATSSTLPSNSN
ncbi:uncharacterized protein [Typha latifolia]|uniref:uncharacterized protein n=1 Tax=Typha latifolia TaxID=4733 RepID=UPI003C2E8642